MVQAPLIMRRSHRPATGAVRVDMANAEIATQAGSNYYSQTTSVLKKIIARFLNKLDVDQERRRKKPHCLR